MLEDVKKFVNKHIDEARKHNIEYLPWDVTNAYLLVKISEQVGALQEAVCRLQDQKERVETLPEDDRRADGGPWSAEEIAWFKKNYTGEVTSESLGDPLDWSDAELDKLAAIGPDDLANAVKLWDNNAPEGFAGLLNAEKGAP